MFDRCSLYLSLNLNLYSSGFGMQLFPEEVWNNRGEIITSFNFFKLEWGYPVKWLEAVIHINSRPIKL